MKYKEIFLHTIQELWLESSHGKPFVIIFLSFVAYAALAFLSFGLLTIEKNFALLWFPTGLYLCVLLTVNRKHWPWVALGCGLANLAVNYLEGKSLLISGCLALGDVAIPMLGAETVARLCGIPFRFQTIRDLTIVGLCGVVGVSLGCATVGSASIGLLQEGFEIQKIWPRWFLCNLNVNTFALLAFQIVLRFDLDSIKKASAVKWLEHIVVFVLLYWCSHLNFTNQDFILEVNHTRIVFPLLLLWVIIRLGLTATIAICCFYGLASFGYAIMLGSETLLLNVLNIWNIFVILFISSALEERNKAVTAYKESQTLYQNIINASGAVCYYRVDKLDSQNRIIHSQYIFMGGNIESLTGYPQPELTPGKLDSIIPDFPLNIETDARDKLKHIDQHRTLEFKIRHKDGSLRWFSDTFLLTFDKKLSQINSLGILQDITQRKEAERDLVKLTELYRGAIQGAGAVPYSQNLTARQYDFMGQGIFDLIGYRPEEVTPALIDDIILETVVQYEAMEISPEIVAQRLHQTPGSKWRADYRVRTRSGAEKWISDAAVNMSDELGNVTRSIGILQDITLKRNLESEQRKIAEIYRKAIECAGAVPFSCNFITGQYDFVGNGIFDLTGYTAQEFTTDLRDRIILEQIIHPSDPDKTEAQIRSQYLNIPGTRWQAEYRIRTKDNKDKWLSDSSIQIIDETGKVVGSLGMLMDITSQTHFIKEKEFLVDGLRSIVEISNELLRVKDPDEVNLRVVELAREKLRLERCSLWFVDGNNLKGSFGTNMRGETTDERHSITYMGSDWFEKMEMETNGNVHWFYTIDDRLEYDETLNCAFQVGHGWVAVTPVQINNKPIAIFFNDGAINNAPYDPVQQELVAIYCHLLANIFERRRHEEEQRQLEAQLHHSQKLESLGVLAGGIAHDFNNLLMGVLGNASLAMIDLPPDSPVMESLTQIEQSAVRAAELSRQMLAYSGKGSFAVEKIDITRIVREMAYLLQVSINKNASLHFDFDDHLPVIQGDATQVRQVIMNLITNASDAIGERPGNITIRTRAAASLSESILDKLMSDDIKDGSYVIVEVRDDGCGMTPETKARIFDPFFTTKFTGRGLGLAAVLGIMRSHKGGINVDSAPGAGSTFTLLFPALEEAGAAAAESIAPLPPQTIRLQGTALIVDDEETVRSVCRRILESHGMTVLTANDGREGVEIFNKNANNIDLVILDMTMPVMSGVEVYAKIRSTHPHVPVLLASGYSEEDAVSQFTEKGLSGYMQKPFKVNDLIEKAASILSRSDSPSRSH